MKARISAHDAPDWCHVCGIRDAVPSVDVFYPDNAEHDPDVGQAPWRNPRAKYIRICRVCLALMVERADEP